MHASRWDGRWLVGACVAACLATLVAAHYRPAVSHAWVRLGVWMYADPFPDVRSLIAGGESLRDGLDPILQNPHDPRGIRANYPHLWFYPFAALKVPQSSTLPLGAALTLAFYASVLLFTGPLGLGEGIVWAGFLCAPPVVQGVVCGNNDLVIFILLALALLVRRRGNPAALGGSYALIALSAALKFFPVCAFCLALRARPRAALTILGSAFAGFAVYLYVIRAQVRAVALTIPDGDFSMYGRVVLFRWYNAAHPGVLSPETVSAWLVVAVGLVAVLVWMRAPSLPGLPEPTLDGLMMGSALYLGTFVLRTSINYRLVFLLFTLPALLALLRGGGVFHRTVAAAGLILLGIGWAFSGQTNLYLVLIKELANWAVFALLAFLWLQCLPTPPWALGLPRVAPAGRRAPAPGT